MKRTKRLYALLGVLLVICAVTFGVSKFEERKEVIKNSGEIILELNSEDVQSLSWKNETDELSFHKDERWIYDEDEAFPVDEETVNEMLEQFRAFSAAFIIEDVEDYGQYGLDDPVCTIKLKTADKDYEIKLGDFSKMDSQRYVSIGDGNAYLMQHDPLDEFDATLREMIDHDDTPDFDKVTEIRFEGDEAYQVTRQEDSTAAWSEEDVYFTQRDGGALPLDTERVEDYLNAISWLDPTDYVTYNATAEELRTYGLDDPDLTVTVQHTNEDEEGEEVPGTFALHIARDPEEKAKAEEEAAKDEAADEDTSEEEKITAYARVGESKIIYKITSMDYEDLMEASYNDLRHQNILPVQFTDISQLDISLEGADYTITTEGEEDKRTYLYQGEEMETAALGSALNALNAGSFTDEEPTEKEEIRLTAHLDNENYPEVEIGLYRYDGTTCLAVVNGTPTCLVPRTAVVDLVEAVNAIVLD